jgi:hypothetical protein
MSVRAKLCLLVLAMGVAIPRTLAAPLQPLEETQVNTKLSWIHWWEANRDRYLAKAYERGPATPAARAADAGGATRGKAVEALVGALSHQDRDVRDEAVLALARMQHAGALPKIREMAQQDADLRVRCRAIVALGLLQDTGTVLNLASKETMEEVARVTALGLLEKPKEAELAALREQAAGSASEEVQRMALWSLRQHRRAADRELALKVLRTTASAVLATEAMMTLAATRGCVGGRGGAGGDRGGGAGGAAAAMLCGERATEAADLPSARGGVSGISAIRRAGRGRSWCASTAGAGKRRGGSNADSRREHAVVVGISVPHR